MVRTGQGAQECGIRGCPQVVVAIGSPGHHQLQKRCLFGNEGQGPHEEIRLRVKGDLYTSAQGGNRASSKGNLQGDAIS
eukprot:5046762-Karenia_brevis.AAC.1